MTFLLLTALILNRRIRRALRTGLRDALAIALIFIAGCATDLPRLSDSEPLAKHTSGNDADDTLPSAAEAGLAKSE